MHDVADEQAIASSDTTPLGTFRWAQVVPPSVETSIIPVLNVVSPTA